jgi:hypothetical protein
VGCPLNGREKAWPMEGHYRVSSLFSKRSNQALRPGPPPLSPCRINTISKHQYALRPGPPLSPCRVNTRSMHQYVILGSCCFWIFKKKWREHGLRGCATILSSCLHAKLRFLAREHQPAKLPPPRAQEGRRLGRRCSRRNRRLPGQRRTDSPGVRPSPPLKWGIWCLLFALIRQGLRGGSGPQIWTRMRCQFDAARVHEADRLPVPLVVGGRFL